ncbi:trypsin-like serine peptidase [Streptomyces sp. NPDC014894]|uniref:trypsin-like serine peptidase n=1 Tax=unclassified Streptomyces TaxID=2593676 RepID=UPI003701195B
MTETSTPLIRRFRGRAAGLAAAGTVLALAFPVTATAVSVQAAPAAADPVSVLKYTAKERKAALGYWTNARMKAVGKSVDLGPTGPKAKPYKGAALKTVGRLFFVNANGADTWCSATAVKSANKSAVTTAAHCVRRGSSPYNTSMDMVFVPGYHKGKTPHGVFAVRSAAAPRSWEEDSVNDMAVLAVDADKKGRKLTDVVGGQSIAFNRPVGAAVTALGYPATRPYLGEELLRCDGKPKKEHGAQVIPCSLSGGASGGPWFADFNAATGKGTLVSVNSALDSTAPTKMYGEILGATAKKVYDRAQRA